MELQLNGAQTFLADYGKGCDPARATVLFVHGAGMDHSVWPLQARHFAYRGWNALAVDLPGAWPQRRRAARLGAGHGRVAAPT